MKSTKEYKLSAEAVIKMINKQQHKLSFFHLLSKWGRNPNLNPTKVNYTLLLKSEQQKGRV